MTTTMEHEPKRTTMEHERKRTHASTHAMARPTGRNAIKMLQELGMVGWLRGQHVSVWPRGYVQVVG